MKNIKEVIKDKIMGVIVMIFTIFLCSFYTIPYFLTEFHIIGIRGLEVWACVSLILAAYAYIKKKEMDCIIESLVYMIEGNVRERDMEDLPWFKKNAFFYAREVLHANRKEDNYHLQNIDSELEERVYKAIRKYNHKIPSSIGRDQ